MSTRVAQTMFWRAGSYFNCHLAANLLPQVSQILGSSLVGGWLVGVLTQYANELGEDS